MPEQEPEHELETVMKNADDNDNDNDNDAYVSDSSYDSDTRERALACISFVSVSSAAPTTLETRPESQPQTQLPARPSSLLQQSAPQLRKGISAVDARFSSTTGKRYWSSAPQNQPQQQSHQQHHQGNRSFGPLPPRSSITNAPCIFCLQCAPVNHICRYKACYGCSSVKNRERCLCDVDEFQHCPRCVLPHPAVTGRGTECRWNGRDGACQTCYQLDRHMNQKCPRHWRVYMVSSNSQIITKPALLRVSLTCPACAQNHPLDRCTVNSEKRLTQTAWNDWPMIDRIARVVLNSSEDKGDAVQRNKKLSDNQWGVAVHPGPTIARYLDDEVIELPQINEDEDPKPRMPFSRNRAGPGGGPVRHKVNVPQGSSLSEEFRASVSAVRYHNEHNRGTATGPLYNGGYPRGNTYPARHHSGSDMGSRAPRQR